LSKIILYIATSIDGYIAKSDGNLDWLTQFPNPTNEDYGYSELLSNCESIIIGSRTFTEINKFDIEWPYSNFKTYVISRQKNFEINTPNTELYSGDLKELINKLMINTSKNCWVVGGGKLVESLLNQNLIDEMIISIIPVLIGNGIPLFHKSSSESKWGLVETKKYDSGVVTLTYTKQNSNANFPDFSYKN
jgi:dihydrofolate reductase